MIVELPTKLEYEVKLIWDNESGGDAYISGFPKLKLDMPVEFGGKGRFPCPDELFFSAVGGCLLTTFLYFKERLKLNLRGLQVSVRGTVDSVGPKGYRIKDIEATFHVEVDEEEKLKAEECTELARDYCHLTRSLERGIPIEVWSEIEVVDKKT
jgi:organic hydroperoxide reductase OsmC/OhrA